MTRDLVAEIFRANVCVMRVRSTDHGGERELSQSSLVLSLLSAVLLLDGGESVRRESGPRRRPRAKRHKKKTEAPRLDPRASFPSILLSLDRAKL